MKKRLLCASTILLCSILFSSCGYRFLYQTNKPTLYIPYITHDIQGGLLSVLAKKIVISNFFDLQTREKDADFILQIYVIQVGDSTVGYGQYLNPNRERNQFIENENRYRCDIEVSLYDQNKKKLVLSPARLRADQNYDYIVDGFHMGNELNIVDFSMGQLDSAEGSYDYAVSKAYEKLADKIIIWLMTAFNSLGGS